MHNEDERAIHIRTADWHKYGAGAALVLTVVRRLIKDSEAERKIIEGAVWTPIPALEVATAIGGGSDDVPMVRRALRKLVDKGALLTANLNEYSMITTLWYAMGKEA